MSVTAKISQSSTQIKVKGQALLRVSMRERGALQIFLRQQPDQGRRKPLTVRTRILLPVRQQRRK
jgi:hypothetical protein